MQMPQHRPLTTGSIELEQQCAFVCRYILRHSFIDYLISRWHKNREDAYSTPWNTSDEMSGLVFSEL